MALFRGMLWCLRHQFSSLDHNSTVHSMGNIEVFTECEIAVTSTELTTPGRQKEEKEGRICFLGKASSYKAMITIKALSLFL